MSKFFLRNRLLGISLGVLGACVLFGLIIWLALIGGDHRVTAALFFLGVISVLLTVINFYLYRWRRILLGSQEIALPEDLGRALWHLNNNVEGLAVNDGRFSRDLNDLVHTTLIFQKALEAKDNEIARLKRGYDAEIFRRFIVRFLKVREALADLQVNNEIDQKSASYLERLLDDALEQCGVERFAPSVGEDYREAIGVADNPSTIPTDNSTKEFKIVSIISHGYKLREEKVDNFLLPARVQIYVPAEI